MRRNAFWAAWSDIKRGKRCKHWWVPEIPEIVIKPPPPPNHPTVVKAHCKHCGMRKP